MIQENPWLQGFQIWKRNVLKMRYVWWSFNQVIKEANKFYYWENTNVRFWFYFSVIAETLMKLPYNIPSILDSFFNKCTFWFRDTSTSTHNLKNLVEGFTFPIYLFSLFKEKCLHLKIRKATLQPRQSFVSFTYFFKGLLTKTDTDTIRI